MLVVRKLLVEDGFEGQKWSYVIAYAIRHSSARIVGRLEEEIKPRQDNILIDSQSRSRKAQEMHPVRRSNGDVCAWISEDTLRDLRGNVVAFFNKEHVFSVRGRTLGRFQRGYFWDMRGLAVGWVEGAHGGPTTPTPATAPFEPYLAYKPSRPYEPYEPYWPYQSSSWSPEPWESFVSG